ncbi:hypothetical protein HN960_04285 [Candidatus Peregrinibacteria bacterium]|jgi:hypothetical protein|nr:hypothetical protein [Candidatus Peregrinibacteria bacterium]MBT7009630.1 hypothetical protein [Candidatus Peregrinibacteria bacterium]
MTEKLLSEIEEKQLQKLFYAYDGIALELRNLASIVQNNATISKLDLDGFIRKSEGTEKKLHDLNDEVFDFVYHYLVEKS